MLTEWLCVRTWLSGSCSQFGLDLRSGRTGFYLAVLEEGQVTPGDAIELIARDEHGVTVTDIVNLYTADATNQDLLQKASELPALPTYWREHLRKRLWDPDS